MSLFGSIMEKIFHAPEAAKAAGSQESGTSGPSGGTAPAGSGGAGSETPNPGTSGSAVAGPQGSTSASVGTPAASASQAVDVGAVLAAKATQKGGGGNYQTSIVDLLKLLDLDSSLSARKQLAEELNVHAGADGSAEENIALHKAVMQKLAENGGNVPADMKG